MRSCSDEDEYMQESEEQEEKMEMFKPMNRMKMSKKRASNHVMEERK